MWAEPLEPRCLLDSGGAAGLLSAGNLTYGSGPLMQNVQIEPIFLKDSGTGKSAPAAERSSLDSFFSNIVAGPYIPSLLSQYSAGGQTIGTGTKGPSDIDVPVTRDTSFKSSTTGNTYPAISDTTIRNAISSQIAQGKIAAVSANTLYFVFTPPGTPVVNVPGSATGNSVDGDGGYTSFFSLGGKNVYYAVVFDPAAPNASLSTLGFGSLSSQQLTVVASHELANAITDPLSDLANQHGTGWYDRDLNQQVADLAHTQFYTQDGNVVQYQWSQDALGPAHAPGTAGNKNNLFINQITPPAVDTFAGGPVATFTSSNPNLTPSSFTAYVSFNGFEGLQPATVSGGASGVYVISAAPSAPLGDGQYGDAFPDADYLPNGGMEIYVFDQADGGAASNAPLSARYAPYVVSVAASLTYNADNGGLAHNFRLVKNTATGNFELYDNGNLVFTQRVAQTFDIQIGADPGVDSSLTLDYSGGTFDVPITFNGGTGAGPHSLTVINGTFSQESYSPDDANSGSFGLDGQVITVSHVTSANIPTTLAITTAPQTILAGQASAAITVQLQDPFGNALPAGAGGVTIDLETTSAGGSFLTTIGQPLSGNTITIPQGSTSAAFEYKDTQPGTPTLTATATSSQPASLAPADYTLNIASYIVTTAADEDNSSPDPALGTGTSLREAINAANAASGFDFIAFNIPGSGVHTISPTSALPTISNPVTIDGYTEPESSPNTNAIDDPDPTKRGFNGKLLIELNGTSAGSVTSGIIITASNTTVRGLVVNRFKSSGMVFDGGNGVIEGNLIGTDVTGALARGNDVGLSGHSSSNRIGGTAPAARNVISGNNSIGILLESIGNATANSIQGNLIGTDVSGKNPLGNGLTALGGLAGPGVVIRQSPGNTIGGTEPGARNVISANGSAQAGAGIAILDNASSTTIQGNYIGLDVGGTLDLGNSIVGISLAGSNQVIGGTTAAARNVISGNQVGIGFSGVTDSRVQGNYIGTDASGTLPVPNARDGISLFGTSNSRNQFGGSAAGAGNVIAFNGAAGFSIAGGVSNSILSNSIFSNAALGIDLAPTGATPNDAGDADTGANKLQNFPVISYATRDAGNLKVTYNVPSDPANSTYPLRVEFFLADTTGQGQTYLAFDTFTATDFAAGGKTVALATAAQTNVFDKIVSTATDSQSAAAGGGPANTSEFSAAATIVSPWQNPGHLRWDVNDDTHVVAEDVLNIINFINGGHGGLIPDDAKNEKPFRDVDGDNHVVATDVINVVNYINSGKPLGGEAEGAAAGATSAWEGEAPAEPGLTVDEDPADPFDSPKTINQDQPLTDVMALLAADVAAESVRKRRA